MLDTSTKKRIDDCRDILVGKLPDPKAQIEQITIGLIYKFMDDMDKEAIELGGAAKFFSGDYEKYAWDNLFDAKVTAAEMLRLYSDAIESMEKNPNIPQLFRDIFNNAYLPYRDPETLKLFLKTIGEFEYTHSEKLGDAFEYLLSVMGSQGDAGQFRTPRHIIDFLVSIIDPDKGETILDPACGTAGFLISAYKHILLKHTKTNQKAAEVQTQCIASQQDTLTRGTEAMHCLSTRHSKPSSTEAMHCLSTRHSKPSSTEAMHCLSTKHSKPSSTEAMHCRSTKHSKPAVQTQCIASQRYNIFSYNQLKDEDKFPITGDQLTPDDRKKLIQNFAGYDISPDMVRLSLVNLYLHGFSDPHINEYDTLSSEDRWNENFDVVLANPPFMSPKGGIRPHKKFTIASNRSEVLFVDYIAEHLNTKGKAGIIVPEGVIFQSGTAYKDLRKLLVDNYLYAVVSLPAGVFNPYSGVKTSILLMDKALAKQRNEILFVKIDNDGYNLGAQRTAVKGSQLEEAIQIIHDFVTSDGDAMNRVSTIENSTIAHAVLRTEIAANGDYNLSGDRYRTIQDLSTTEFEIVKIGDVFKTSSGGTPLKDKEEYYKNGNIPWLRSGEVAQGFITSSELFITKEGLKNSSAKIFPIDTVLVAMYGATAGQVGILKFEACTNQAVCGVLPNDKAIPEYLYLVLKSQKDYMISLSGGGAQPNISQKIIRDLQIPLPPLSIQEEIVAEIEGYQKIIDGAKAVVANYKPKIDIEPDWEMVELQEICESISDGDHQPPPKSEEGVPFITISNIDNSGYIDFSKTYYVPASYYNEIKSHRKPKSGDILYTVTGSYGIPVFIDFEKEFCFQRHIGLIRPKSSIVGKYLFHYLQSTDARSQADRTATGMAQKTVSLKSLRQFIIPKPPVETQRQIVAQIEKEQALVNANKQLIEIFEQKIKDRIAKVWGTQETQYLASQRIPANENISLAAEPETEYSQEENADA